MNTWKMFFIKLWAIFVAKLQYPKHKGTYRIVKSYTPGKKNHGHKALLVSKKDKKK